MRMLASLVLMLCACPQVEILCTESDRCEPPEPPPPDMTTEPDLSSPPPMHFTKLELPAGTPSLRGIAGVAGGNTIYAVGNGATIVTGDGVAPFVKTATSPTPSGTLNGIFLASAQELWVADGTNSTVHHTTNGGATWTNSMAGAAYGLQAVFGKSNAELLAVGQDIMEGRHYMSGWAAARYPGSLKKQMYGVWASANNYYVVGVNAAVGKSSNPRSAFTDISIPGGSATLRSVWGIDDNNVFTVGGSGVIYKYDGTQWSSMPQGSSTLNAIWGSSAQDLWVVGDNASVYHYDGTQWKNASTAHLSGYHLTGVWGDGNGGVFVAATDTAGTSGAIFKY